MVCLANGVPFSSEKESATTVCDRHVAAWISGTVLGNKQVTFFPLSAARNKCKQGSVKSVSGVTLSGKGRMMNSEQGTAEELGKEGIGEGALKVSFLFLTRLGMGAVLCCDPLFL